MSVFPLLPIVVGVSGHRDIHPGSVALIGDRVRNVLQSLAKLYPESLCVMSALAAGADQVVAEITIELGLPLICVLPMERSQYRDSFDFDADALRFDKLIDHHSVCLRMTLPPPGASVGSVDDAVLCYEQLGIFMSRQSHILLALWDGDDPEPPGERGCRMRTERRGGTAHVVAIRTRGEHAEVADDIFIASQLFSARLPRLQLARGGPILHVETPRASSHAGGADSAGRLRWWSDLGTESQAGVVPRLRDGQGWLDLGERCGADELAGELSPLMPRDFRFIRNAADVIRTTWRDHPDECAASAAALCGSSRTAAGEGSGNAGLACLQMLFAGADTVSFRAQQALLGDWAPGLPWRRAARGRRRLASLFWLSLAAPASVLSFELYVATGHRLLPLLCYGAILAAAAAFYWGCLKPRQWQTLYQDHRALAEALRVQYFWAASRLPLSVSDSYLGQHEGELGWIRLALRGPALVAVATAFGPIAAIPRECLCEAWIKDQHAYFVDRVERCDQACRFLERALRASVIVLIGLVILLLARHLFLTEEPPRGWLEWLDEAPNVAVGTLPALAAFFLAFLELRLFEDHAHAYEKSAAVFDRALQQATLLVQGRDGGAGPQDETDGGATSRSWTDLLVALGRESLAENATWIQAHRARPITLKIG